MPQGQPVRCAVLNGPGRFELHDLPTGRWYVLVHSVPYGRETTPSGIENTETVSVGRYGPIHVRSESRPDPVEILLRPLALTDPPILMALLDLRTRALA
ncbi:hypothetical protein LZF96_04745 [Streptomyces sp. ST2-7A]|nr:hypothetical protein [Streptomyces sp. ST2-7A]MCE7079507.1 hypothetical protein [Streptomyces sp. ST2-7A]